MHQLANSSLNVHGITQQYNIGVLKKPETSYTNKAASHLLKLRPELRGEDNRVDREGLLAELQRPRVGRVEQRVEPLRVGDVLEHDLALVERRLAETQLEELEVADLLLGLVGESREQAVGEKGAVLVDEELLRAVDVHQHRDDVGSPATWKGRIGMTTVKKPFHQL